MAGKAFSGAAAKVYAETAKGRVEVGWATGISGNENIALQRVDVLGEIDSQEIEPVGRTVSFTCEFVRIKSAGLQEMGLAPRGDTVAVLEFPELTFEIWDQVDDKVRIKLMGCKCESRGWRLDRQSVMTENASYQARAMYDEAGIAAA